MTTINPYNTNSGNEGGSKKGSSENPYTKEEFEQMQDAGTWQGGYVEGMGYWMGVVTVTASYPDSDSFGSEDSWPSEDSWSSDTSSPFGNGTNPPTGGGAGGGNTPGGGNNGNNGSYTGGNATGTGNTSSLSPKETAISKINSFEKNQTTTVFPNLSKNEFVESLKNHINSPLNIDQGKNGTCGAAVICKYLAENMPIQYVEAAISLYTTGKYDPWELELPEASKTGTMEQIVQIGTTVTDILMQGAIVHSYNFYVSYNPFTDGSGFRSFMWPLRIDAFFEKLNKQGEVSLNVNYDNLSKMDYANNFVIAGVCVGSYNSKKECDFICTNIIPNHYVQIVGCADNIVSYWQWGGIYTSKNGGVYFTYSIPR